MAAPTSALGQALQTWRSRVSPAAVGLPNGSRRRVQGLRREELARLAGLSVDYLVRLEQGRATRPSAEVVGALARALRLSPAERDLLFAMAGAAGPTEGKVPTYVPPSVQRMLDRFVDTPAGVFTATWTLIRWNDMWEALAGDPSLLAGWERNLVWRHFTGAGSRVRLDASGLTRLQNWLMADLRLASIRYPDDEDISELIEIVSRDSEVFAELWGRFDADPTPPDTSTFVHPTVGEIALDCDVLRIVGDDLRMMVFTAEPETRDAASLELLAVVGTQQMQS